MTASISRLERHRAAKSSAYPCGELGVLYIFAHRPDWRRLIKREFIKIGPKYSFPDPSYKGKRSIKMHFKRPKAERTPKNFAPQGPDIIIETNEVKTRTI